MNLSRPTFWIILACVLGSVGITVYVFAASRLDPGLRMAALVAATNIASALMATASTMLTGKDFSSRHPDPADLPPGSVVTQKDTVQTPPVAPPVPS